MSSPELKADLQRYLQSGRDALLWKLEGLSEYDVRRPMTPTGTNLLGLVKHLAYVEFGYFGATFGRPVDEARAWADDTDDEPNWDMWATAAQSRDQVVGMYRRACAHADETIESLPLDAPAQVSWWKRSGGEVTLHRVLVHVIAETDRHVGHADIVRELIDGAVGLRSDHSNLPAVDGTWWEDHRSRLEMVAQQFRTN